MPQLPELRHFKEHWTAPGCQSGWSLSHFDVLIIQHMNVFSKASLIPNREVRRKLCLKKLKDHCFSPGKLEFLALKCSVSNKCVTLSYTFVHDWQQEQPTSYVLNSLWLNYCTSQDHRNNWLDIKYHSGRSEGAADALPNAHLHAEAFVRMHIAEQRNWY